MSLLPIAVGLCQHTLQGVLVRQQKKTRNMMDRTKDGHDEEEQAKCQRLLESLTNYFKPESNIQSGEGAAEWQGQEVGPKAAGDERAATMGGFKTSSGAVQPRSASAPSNGQSLLLYCA